MPVVISLTIEIKMSKCTLYYMYNGHKYKSLPTVTLSQPSLILKFVTTGHGIRVTAVHLMPI